MSLDNCVNDLMVKAKDQKWDRLGSIPRKVPDIYVFFLNFLCVTKKENRDSNFVFLIQKNILHSHYAL